MGDYSEVFISIPDRVFAQLNEVSGQTGMSVDDLVAGACDLIYAHPTRGGLRRVLRRAHVFKIEKILANFPKSRRDESRESDED